MNKTKWRVTYSAGARNHLELGFTLIELMIATAIFLVVSSAAFMLFSKQQKSFQQQQGQSGMNIALRNAASQIQLDVSNAGTAYFQGANIAGWPVGVTIVNNVVASGSSCYNAVTLTYTATCFDTLNIIEGADPAQFPPIDVTDSGNGTGSAACSYSDSGSAYGKIAPSLTLAQTAAKFLSGDQLLLLSQDGTKMTSVKLTSNASVSGSVVQLSFNATHVDGTNSMANDPLNITACGDGSCPTVNNFTNKFCDGDWIIKLAPITYWVDSSVPSNPRLKRTQSTAGTVATETLMDQAIGFKVGATIWQSSTDTVSTQYNYDASTYDTDATNGIASDQAWNFTLARSVRISLIGRTKPNTDFNYSFRNAFDNGAYQVEGISVVANPRNLSMND